MLHYEKLIFKTDDGTKILKVFREPVGGANR